MEAENELKVKTQKIYVQPGRFLVFTKVIDKSNETKVSLNILKDFV